MGASFVSLLLLLYPLHILHKFIIEKKHPNHILVYMCGLTVPGILAG